MPTSTISNVTTDINGNVVSNVAIVITLQPPGGFRLTDLSEVAAQYSTTSDGSGSWSVALEQTANISPSGSFYVVQEQYPASAGGYREYAFTVGPINATLFASLLAANPPTPTTNYLTQAQGDARYAPFGSITTNLAFKNVVDFGAVGDGTTDDQPAIQNAINALPTTGGTVYFPPALVYYKLGGTLTVSANGTRLVGAGRFVSTIRSNVADVITIGGSGLSYLFLESIGVISGSGGGHCFHQSADLSNMNAFDCYFEQNNAAKSIWDNNGKLYLDCLVLGCHSRMHTAATEPGWKMVAAGAQINSNTWQGGRYNGGSGAYVFKFENTSGTTWLLDNRFRDVNFENPSGGCIKGLSVASLRIEDCTVYDLTTVSSSDLYAISASSGILASRDIIFDGVKRISGTLGGGLADIDIDAGTLDIRLFSVGRTTGAGTGFIVNLNNAPTIGEYSLTGITVTGTNNLTQIQPGGTLTLYGGGLTTSHAIYPGTDGVAIQTAAGIYAGSGLPNNANGNNGDFYFRSDGTAGANTVVYHKETGAWVALITT